MSKCGMTNWMDKTEAVWEVQKCPLTMGEAAR